MKNVIEWYNEQPNYGIFCPPMSNSTFIAYIMDYLLGENWFSVNPVNGEQLNTEILFEVLEKYSKRYRKEKRAYAKKHR